MKYCKTKVMIVRQNEHAVHHNVLTETLELSGYEVIHAEPREALQYFITERPNAVITTRMPNGHNSDYVIERIRNYEDKRGGTKSHITLIAHGLVSQKKLGADALYNGHVKNIPGSELMNIMSQIEKHIRIHR